MGRRRLDIQKTYVKKSFVVSKEKLKEGIDRADVTMYLEQETHYDNGESELVYRMYIKDNFN